MDTISATKVTEHGNGDPVLTADAAKAWLREMVDAGTLSPCRVLVLSGDMAEEAITLHKLDFAVCVVDRSRESLSALSREARSRGARGIQTVHADVLGHRPGLFGSVDLVLDRAFLPTLESIQRADWAHMVGRTLPSGGRLAAMFRIGRSSDGPPYSVSQEALEKLLGRHFKGEILEAIGNASPGSDRAFRGLFRRK